ncbi:1-aminocyclopropane-1-carboxylate deaminase/D-cysteine desulfhydrase [Thalassolituus hydrocarboniclasticus]|uniref:Pyridoxal-phosphate dependent enzyme n=1 Tax=Thalassolituus hydrocarboniclasticus TaxID=2742796 RepID=A0ABY6A4Q1_9GAMM|nr:pyridoxal-phosphate dependent enzyme [Thalassolituus hydrocarboniclasticus]UXD86121.1 pyridoxal-phosphate dependent enzyme [Thalassolituus hydrocarboniclasticus]
MSLSPLFNAYPALQKRIPLADIPGQQIPTPVTHSLDTPQLWLKHDDLTNAVYGGNKSRKLALIFGKMQAEGKNRLLTFGGTGTNHGVACAVHSKALGIDCEILLFDQPESESVRKNRQVMQRYGATLRYSGSLLNTVLRFYTLQIRDRLLRRKQTEYLFAGGSSLQGVIAFIDAVFELREQIERGECPLPETIICPVGSSATLAGLTLGVALAGLPSRVIGVRVAPTYLGPFPACTVATVKQLMQQTQQYLLRLQGGIPPFNIPQPVLLDQYYGEGYGVASAAGNQAEQWFRKQRWADGLTVQSECTYTAKALAALRDELATASGPVLYWHTLNSVQGIYSEAEAV